MSKKQSAQNDPSKEVVGGGKQQHVCIRVEIFLGLPNPSPLELAFYEGKHGLIASKY